MPTVTDAPDAVTEDESYPSALADDEPDEVETEGGYHLPPSPLPAETPAAPPLRFTCDRDVLRQVCEVAGRAVSRRSSLPILSNLFLEVRDGDGPHTLSVVGTDLEIGIEVATTQVNVLQEGAATVPARDLRDLVRHLRDGEVTVTADAETDAVTFADEGATVELRGLPACEFSTLPEVQPRLALDDCAEGEKPIGFTCTVPAELLRTVIDRTAFAVSPEETRPILTAVLFTAGADGLRLVATDTHRLAVDSCGALEGEGGGAVLVPARTLEEVGRLCKTSGDIAVTCAYTQIAFAAEGDGCKWKVKSRLIDGDFPKYEKTIPNTYERALEVNAEEFGEVLRRCLVVAREDCCRVVLQLSPTECRVVADSQDRGHGEDAPLPAATFEGEVLEIAFNGRYLLDALACIPKEGTCRFELCGVLNPGVMRCPDVPSWTYLLMPMQIM